MKTGKRMKKIVDDRWFIIKILVCEAVHGDDPGRGFVCIIYVTLS